MTTAMLGWFIAGICFTAFIILWFWVSYREIYAKRCSLDSISEQVTMHRKLFMQERGGAFDASAQTVLTNKLIAYSKAEMEYNALLKKPAHCIPAYILGFRPTGKSDRL